MRTRGLISVYGVCRSAKKYFFGGGEVGNIHVQLECKSRKIQPISFQDGKVTVGKLHF